MIKNCLMCGSEFKTSKDTSKCCSRKCSDTYRTHVTLEPNEEHLTGRRWSCGLANDWLSRAIA